MPKKYVVFFKSVGRMWFVFLVIAIIVVFFYNQEAAIWITGITIGLYLLSYLPGFLFNRKLVNHMKEYFMIEDDTVAKNLRKPLTKIKEKMYELSQRQRKKDWLIVFHEKHYIFYHEQTVEKYLDLYSKGYNEKQILDSLKENDLRTRAEVKAFRTTLLRNDRLVGREISVKEREEAERFNI